MAGTGSQLKNNMSETSKEIQSPSGQLNRQDLARIGKTFLYSMASALIGFLISLIPQLNIPMEYSMIATFIVPVVNTLLVTIKKIIDGKVE